VFQSVTCRTAGFNTLDTALLSAPALAVAVALMFVGASPGSCGGGVKTTTVAVLAAFAFSRMRRWSRVNMFRRSIPESTVNRSLALTLLALLVISVAFLCLLFVSVPGGSAGHSQFLPLLFESVSAFGTVGLSMGVTPDLASAGKWLVILLMFIGRVGVITFAYVFIGQQASRGLELAEENVMIG
jgi:trk system potassium uptake protein TrkH